MPADNPRIETRPFVETAIARDLISRIQMTHDEQAISVFSGPWGIGKTTAIDVFASEQPLCAVVKVEPGPRGRGATAARVLQYVAERLARHQLTGWSSDVRTSDYLALRQIIIDFMSRLFGRGDPGARFTFIFDEAQHLSREAIETLRYWNDRDRCTTPFPVGLVFVGNREFNLEDDFSGSSVISGAVRSRALFIEALDYSDVTDADLALFCQSRGIDDAGAISRIVQHYSTARAKRDLRNVERLLGAVRLRANGEPVTAAIVDSILRPA